MNEIKPNLNLKNSKAQTYTKVYKLGLSKISKVNGRTRVNNASIWTEDELYKLKIYYPTGGYKECQKHGVNKTMYNITSKATLLGIKRLNESISEPTKEEKEKKVILESKNSAVEKSKAINPNANAIKNGLMTPFGWSKEDIKILVEYYPVGGTSLCQEKGLNKKNSTIRMMAKSLGIFLNKKRPWTNSEDKLLAETFEKHNTKEACYEVFSTRTKTDINARLKDLDLVLKKRWSKKDIEILKEYFPIGGARLVIEKGVNRTIREIGAKASNMGIKVINGRKYWSKEEETILRKYYPIEGISVIKRLKDKDELSIRNKVRHMKLNGPINKWEDEEIEILTKYYPIEGGKIKDRLPNKTMANIYYKASQLKLKSNNK